MLSLFRKKKKTIETNAVQDRIVQSIVAKCLQLQQRWADDMQRRSERLSTGGKRIAFTLFCLAAGSLSIYLIAASLAGSSPAAFSVSGIKTPRHIRVGEPARPAVIITKQEYERIAGYHRYIDSLARSPTGKSIYDSLLSRHPGLLDSLHFIENIYLSQPKQ